MELKELKELSLEDTFTKLDELMNNMQSDETSLEDSFALYNDGMQMLAHCKDVIDTVEKKIKQLSLEAEDNE